MRSKHVKTLQLWHSRLDERLQKSKLQVFRNLVSGLVEEHVGLKEKERFEGAFRARRGDLILEFASELDDCVSTNSENYFAIAQIVALVKKYPYDKTFQGLDPEGTARKTFSQKEEECKAVNISFRQKRREWDPNSEKLTAARRWISYVIGDKPVLRDIYRKCDFGPGASVGVHGQATSFARKMLSDTWTTTPSALPYFMAAIRRDPLVWEMLLGSERSESNFDLFDEKVRVKLHVIDYNKIAFVPKTAKTHRSIAIEPLCNSFIQKGTDEYLRQRLKRVGIDLSDQSLNQELARQGSLSSEEDPYCTIDLSSASDSISIELCREILPEAWFDFLNRIRSPAYCEDEEIHPYNKFVSMGNGFCFPLETLIFASICHATGCLKGDFIVYGDDIIVRKSRFGDVISLLKDCGFTPNENKTFSEGHFRESCGADWYDGSDVRPVTLDFELDSVRNIIKFSNITKRREITSKFFTKFRALCFENLEGSKLPFVRPYQGPDDSALEIDLDVFQTCDYVTFHKDTMSWEWTELLSTAMGDRYKEEAAGFPAVLLMAALKGASSEKPFVYRRKTRTSYRRVSTGGAQSTWVPA